ncbi:MAG: fused response regulator/phosphatase [Deltaproteobacteria bacterium]|nr:MAG: fused response regulator/phosphatase [Deltaproteobacteria bacterium]
MEEKQNLTILIVDDNPVSVKLLEAMLRKEGYQVITASDGPQAREVAFEEQPDLIILDVMMPGEDGFEVITHLKKNARTASIPVIFLTGRYELDAKLAGFDLGAVDYITKPFQAPEVLARVQLHLKLSRATNSLIASQASRLKQLEEAQTSMLTAPEELPRAHFSVYYSALLEAGGDFYDVFRISDDMFGYFVVDVSGHNIATSYITAAVKALLKQNCTPIYKPVESMRMINDVLAEILPEGIYLTACYAKLNRKKKLLSIVNAGHPPAVYLPKEGEARLTEVDGDILGIFNEVYYGQQDIKVTTGDRFFLYSDGLIERPALKKVWFECLPDLLEACSHLKDVPIQEAAEQLTRLMIGQNCKPEDDIVVLGVEV